MQQSDEHTLTGANVSALTSVVQTLLARPGTRADARGGRRSRGAPAQSAEEGDSNES
jgi:hypothetical protein